MYRAPVSIFRLPSVIRLTRSLKFSSCMRSTSSSTCMMFRTDCIVLDEGVNRRVDHLDRSVCHLPDSRKLGLGTARRRTELQREFPDVFRVPSDPVQVGRDLERGRDRPKIPSDGRMEGDEVDARVLDLELETVDLLIDREDLSRNFSVEAGQRVDGLSDRELAELGEGHHILVQFLQ